MKSSLLFIWTFCFINIVILLLFLFRFVFLVLILLFLLFFLSFNFLFDLFLEKFVDWWFVKSSLKPNSVHFKSCLSILQKFTMKINFYFLQSTFFSHQFQLLFVEIIHANSILLHIKIIFEFSIAFTCKIELTKVISSVIPEIKKRAWLHPINNLFEHFKMFFRNDRWKNKYQRC